MNFLKSSDSSSSSFPRSSGQQIGVVESLIAKRIVESISEPKVDSPQKEEDASSGASGTSDDSKGKDQGTSASSHAEFYAGPSCAKLREMVALETRPAKMSFAMGSKAATLPLQARPVLCYADTVRYSSVNLDKLGVDADVKSEDDEDEGMGEDET